MCIHINRFVAQGTHTFGGYTRPFSHLTPNCFVCGSMMWSPGLGPVALLRIIFYCISIIAVTIRGCNIVITFWGGRNNKMSCNVVLAAT